MSLSCPCIFLYHFNSLLQLPRHLQIFSLSKAYLIFSFHTYLMDLLALILLRFILVLFIAQSQDDLYLNILFVYEVLYVFFNLRFYLYLKEHITALHISF